MAVNDPLPDSKQGVY